MEIKKTGILSTWAAFVLALLSMIFAGILWLSKVPSTKIYLTSSTEAVGFKVERQCDWEEGCNLDPTSVILNNMGNLDFSRLPLNQDWCRSGQAWISLKRFKMRLSELHMAPGTPIVFEQQGRSVLMMSGVQKGISGGVTLIGKGQYRMGCGPTQSVWKGNLDLSMPEFVNFASLNNEHSPMELSAIILDDIRIPDIKISDLVFSRRVNISDNVKFASPIIECNLTMQDVNKTVNLLRGEPLILENPQGVITELIIGDEIRLGFSGTVTGIRRGYTNFGHDLMPSSLEYIYHNNRLILLFNAITFLWGVIWSLRRK